MLWIWFFLDMGLWSGLQAQEDSRHALPLCLRGLRVVGMGYEYVSWLW